VTQGAGSNDKNSAAAPASTGPSWVGRGCPEPPDHGLGRSRGGFTSKLHLITDGRGRPISIGLTGGNVNDTTMLEPALGEIRVPLWVPETRPTSCDLLIFMEQSAKPVSSSNGVDLGSGAVGQWL
jgi:hypothetical protein